MAKLDDLFNKKKETAPILDLSRATVTSKEEFRKLFDKVPDFKTRPERVRGEEAAGRVRDKDLTFKMSRRETRALREPYTMADPVPPDMRALKLEDLTSVPIDWKMLTSLRPKTKLEEEYYSRLIELGKSELKTISREKREAIMTPSIRKTKNKAGVLETRAISCVECGEEFCTGKFCGDFAYECYTRVAVPTSTAVAASKSVGAAVVAALATNTGAATAKNGGVKPRRSRKKRKFPKRKRSRSKSPAKNSRSRSENRKAGAAGAAPSTRCPKHKSGSKSE